MKAVFLGIKAFIFYIFFNFLGKFILSNPVIIKGYKIVTKPLTNINTLFILIVRKVTN